MSINPELDDEIEDIRDKLGPDSLQEKMVRYLVSLGHEQNCYLPAYFFKECAGKKATQRKVTAQPVTPSVTALSAVIVVNLGDVDEAV